ncbi:hypothetical protein CQW23_22657 [Capsicum baccatum]|uniref:F-box domain-containing protein n=1 Tax=Capsicum baccatum TaxID=33114 RepID=A0A2G2W1I1_CAPBA|nr:hypothetical protein CQW23_22657 [Capsicum baccatum]
MTEFCSLQHLTMRRATPNVLLECLIQEILCFLSYEEAAKMRILSKTWLQASLTLPNLKFTVDHSNGNMKIVAYNIMERYRKGKIPIETFELSKFEEYQLQQPIPGSNFSEPTIPEFVWVLDPIDGAAERDSCHIWHLAVVRNDFSPTYLLEIEFIQYIATCPNIEFCSLQRLTMKRATIDILPECVIHKILLFLRYEEAIKMSVLSKTWLQASLTLPNLKFKDKNMKIVVDNIMERYRKGKIPIEKFELSDYSNNSQVFLLIDKWLHIAFHNGVKDLVFRLSLSHVTLDEDMLQALLNSCPLIVSFILEYCSGLKKIELLNLQKIKSVSVKVHKSQRLKIQAQTLEHLFYSGFSKEVDVVECQNLKSLELSGVYISDGSLQRLISRSQFLESLMIVNVSNWGLGRFNICKSRSLKMLKLKKCDDIKKIDATNLVSIEYEGFQIPKLKLGRESSQLKHSKIVLRSLNYLNAAWFCKLRKFLSNTTSWSQVSLYFPGCSRINMNDWQLHHIFATPEVDVLNVYSAWKNEGFPTFMDALLWTCHPKILNLHSTREMATCFMDHLMYMKNSSQSTSHGSKPWYSQLKEVKACKIDKKNESWHRVEHKGGKLATRNPGKTDQYSILLNW